jgi:hypothetical protein
MEERGVQFLDAIYVLQNGYHEKKKTIFHEASQKWRYAIRGKTPDFLELRIVITFDETNMIIITVVDLLKKEGV